MEILRADRIARMLLVTRDGACEIREARSSREDDSPPPLTTTCLDVAACGSSHDRSQRASAKCWTAQKWNQISAYSWLRADDCGPCI